MGRVIAEQRVGILIGTRHLCRDCETHFDVPSPFGTVALIALGIVVIALVWTVPGMQYADGPWIRAIVTAGGLGSIAFGASGVRTRQRHPLVVDRDR